MSNKYNPAGAASSLKSQYAKTEPCGADTVAKHFDKPQGGTGMGYNPAQAAKCLDYWDNPGAADKSGPQTIPGL